MTKIKRCGHCGSRNVSLQDVKGSLFPFKNFAKVKLGVSLELPVCGNCKNVMYGTGDAQRLDQAIESSLKLSAKSYVEQILELTDWNQIEMAEYLGYSPVYISEVKTGKRIPDAKSLYYFRVLANCPQALDYVTADDPYCSAKKKYSVKFGDEAVVSKRYEVSEDDFNDYGMVA